jgi:hypothetical protein
MNQVLLLHLLVTTDFFLLLLNLLLDVTEQMILEFGPEEEFEMTLRTVVRSHGGSIGCSVQFKHVALEIGGSREQATAEVTGISRTTSKRVLNQVSLQFERCLKLATAQSARMKASFGQQVTGNVRLNLGFSGEYFLTFDALKAPWNSSDHCCCCCCCCHLLLLLLMMDSDAILADVRRYAVRDQMSRFESSMTKAARIEGSRYRHRRRRCRRVEAGV